jgi:SnoaL-like domain
MAVAVMGAGGLLIEPNRAVAASTAPDTSRALAPTPTVGFPRQAWASKDNRIALKAPAAVRSTGNALDYLLINEQFGRFGMAHDELQIDVLRQLFAKNAKLELMRGVGQPFATYDGVDAIVENFERVLRFQADQRRHCMSNILIEDLTRNTAQALAYGIVTIAHDGLSIGATVVYSAQFVRKSGQPWQFSKLMIGMDDYAAVLPPPPK